MSEINVILVYNSFQPEQPPHAPAAYAKRKKGQNRVKKGSKKYVEGQRWQKYLKNDQKVRKRSKMVKKGRKRTKKVEKGQKRSKNTKKVIKAQIRSKKVGEG